MWSPKRNRNGARNQFYENMLLVQPGDLVFSFNKTRIPAIGKIRSVARESPKPNEFGSTGANWNPDGWRVDVDYELLERVMRTMLALKTAFSSQIAGSKPRCAKPRRYPPPIA